MVKYKCVNCSFEKEIPEGAQAPAACEKCGKAMQPVTEAKPAQAAAPAPAPVEEVKPAEAPAKAPAEAAKPEEKPAEQAK